MLSLKTNGLDKHAKGMSLHLGCFDTASSKGFKTPIALQPVGKITE